MVTTRRADTGQVGLKVRSFYERCSYPGYDEFDSLEAMVRRALQNAYVKLLDEQIPLGARIADIGCGTGQLPILLSVSGRRVVGADFSLPSLRKGHTFVKPFGLKRVGFAQMDIFNPALRRQAFDYVFCVGVLHHTADPFGGFKNVCTLVKPGGYIIIGLYNTYGRLMLDLRRVIFRATGGRLRRIDALVRGQFFGDHKKEVWYADQYQHPHESKHSVDEVLGWFDQQGIEFVNAVPKIRLGESLTPDEKLFERNDAGTKFEHVLRQLGWIFTQGSEGGFFLMIGRKKA
jgi:SAM-dependent methyltransferase